MAPSWATREKMGDTSCTIHVFAILHFLVLFYISQLIIHIFRRARGLNSVTNTPKWPHVIDTHFFSPVASRRISG